MIIKNSSGDGIHPGKLLVATNVGAQLVHLLFKTPEDAKQFLETTEISVELDQKVLIRRKKADQLLMSLTEDVGRGIFLQMPINILSHQQVSLQVWHDGRQLTVPVTH